jgi:hypothetical protein
MAVARLVRFLGALCVVLVFFLLFQLWQPTGSAGLSPPSRKDGDKIEHMENDPLLDREFSCLNFNSLFHTVFQVDAGDHASLSPHDLSRWSCVLTI